MKKFAALRIIHEKYKGIGMSIDLVMQKTQFEKSFEYAATVANDLKRNIPRAIDNIDPQTALRLFQMISPQVEILISFSVLTFRTTTSWVLPREMNLQI